MHEAIYGDFRESRSEAYISRDTAAFVIVCDEIANVTIE